MMQAAYTAKMGIISQQRRMDTIADNLANVSTNGFKSSRVDFKDVLYNQMVNPEEPEAATGLQKGHGVTVAGTTTDFSSGTPEDTGQSLDFYIDGEGFFMVEGSQGGIQYMRSGAMAVSNEEDGTYLVNGSGYYVLDENGERITIPDGTESLTVSLEGQMSIDDSEPFATLGLVTFPNLEGLVSVGQSMYETSVASGEPVESDASVLQGYLEESNVDFSLEITRMVRAQRAFSLASSALQTADEMDAVANRIPT